MSSPRCQGLGTITTLGQILLRLAGQRPPSPLVGGRHQVLQQAVMMCLVLGSTTGVLVAATSTHEHVAQNDHSTRMVSSWKNCHVMPQLPCRWQIQPLFFLGSSFSMERSEIVLYCMGCGLHISWRSAGNCSQTALPSASLAGPLLAQHLEVLLQCLAQGTTALQQQMVL